MYLNKQQTQIHTQIGPHGQSKEQSTAFSQQSVGKGRDFWYQKLSLVLKYLSFLHVAVIVTCACRDRQMEQEYESAIRCPPSGHPDTLEAQKYWLLLPESAS